MEVAEIARELAAFLNALAVDAEHCTERKVCPAATWRTVGDLIGRFQVALASWDLEEGASENPDGIPVNVHFAGADRPMAGVLR